MKAQTGPWFTLVSPQGSIVGPMLFLLYVNDIPENLSCSSEMFADDTLLFNSDQPSSVHQPVCESLSQIVDWCKKWLLKLKATKCKCMRITRSRSVTPCSYNINSIPLEQVKTHKHLGVIISSDLSWKPHVLSVAAKANKILGLLKRTFGKCSEAITIGYKSMVRPIVEYACPVWNPHQQYLSDKLERVQRNASRWILGSSIDYSERLEYLGWPTLNSRREFLSLVQLFKFINGFSRVDLCNYLTFSNSRTRSTNNVKIWTPYARTNILKNSFWYKYIKIWNDLPSDTISSSSASKFKKKLKEHIFK